MLFTRSLLALGAIVAAAAAERAALACSCPPVARGGVVFPRVGDRVPPDTRVLGLVQTGSELPVIVAAYAGDPARPIAGPQQAERVGTLTTLDVWAWRPAAPFDDGETVDLTIQSTEGEMGVRFTVANEGVLMIPGRGLSGATAVVTTIGAVEPTRSSCGAPLSGSVQTRYEFTGLENLAPGTILRYLASDEANTRTTTLATGLDEWRVGPMPCGISVGCEPTLDAPLEPGVVVCLAVELEDPQGRRSGRDNRFCGVVRAETRDWVDDGAFGRCTTSAADGGVDIPPLAEVDSCACAQSAGGAPWALALAAGALLHRRRRSR